MAKVEVSRCAMLRIDNTPAANGTDPATAYGICNCADRKISQNLRFSEAWVVIPNADVPESANYPLVEDFLKAVAARATAQIPVYIGQTMIVTRQEGL